MAPLIAVASATAIAAAIAFGIVIGWGLRGLANSSRCGCGHAWGSVDKFTAHCTATVIETNFVAGVRRTRKRVACPCRRHVPPGMTAPEIGDRDFIVERAS